MFLQEGQVLRWGKSDTAAQADAYAERTEAVTSGTKQKAGQSKLQHGAIDPGGPDGVGLSTEGPWKPQQSMFNNCPV